MKSLVKSLFLRIKDFFDNKIKLNNGISKKNISNLLKLFFKEVLTIFINRLSSRKYINITLLGKDGYNWSVDKDKENVEYFLKLNDHKISNIFHCSHLFCLRYDVLLKTQFIWVKILKKFLRFKIITFITNDIRLYKQKFSKLKNIVDLWVAPSKKIYDFLKREGVNLSLIPFYVCNKEFFFLNKSKEEICNYLKLNYNKVKGKLIVGSFQRDTSSENLKKPKWQKNPDLLIRILRDLPKDQFVLLLAGPLRHYVVNKCEQYNLPYLYYGDFSYIKNNQVDILINNHPSDAINLLYNLSDVYIVSSRSEGGPKAIIEASLTKTLIFSSNVGFASDFLHKDLIFSENNFNVIVSFLVNFVKNKGKIEEYLRYNFKNAKAILNEQNYMKSINNLISLIN